MEKESIIKYEFTAKEILEKFGIKGEIKSIARSIFSKDFTFHIDVIEKE